LVDDNGKPALPVYILTGAGTSIASILSWDRSATAQDLFNKINSDITEPVARLYIHATDAGADQWLHIGGATSGGGQPSGGDEVEGATVNADD
jgi:hypothetical protein